MNAKLREENRSYFNNKGKLEILVKLKADQVQNKRSVRTSQRTVDELPEEWPIQEQESDTTRALRHRFLRILCFSFFVFRELAVRRGAALLT